MKIKSVEQAIELFELHSLKQYSTFDTSELWLSDSYVIRRNNQFRNFLNKNRVGVQLNGSEGCKRLQDYTLKYAPPMGKMLRRPRPLLKNNEYLCAIFHKQAFYATTKAREKRHGHLPCDARAGIKNLSLWFLVESPNVCTFLLFIGRAIIVMTITAGKNLNNRMICF